MVCCKVCYTAPPRHMLTILAFLGLTLGFCMRQVLPITIQEMTYPILGKGPRLSKDYGDKFAWTDLQEALILMGFYLGYSISHFFSGPIINAMGARGPIIMGMTISAIMTALIPIACSFDWSAVMVMRIITGVGQSTLLPGISSLMTYWIPLESRATISAIIYAGVPLGTFLGIYLSAIVVIYCEHWSIAYYMWGCFTLLWLCFFLVYIYSYPETHPRIITQGSSYQRPNFIQQEIRAEHIEKLTYCCQTMSTFGHTYIIFTLDTYLPKYLNEVLECELEDYSIYAGTPFVMMYMCGIISRSFYTSIVSRRNLNADFVRLIYCSLCNVICGGVLVLAFAFAFNYSITLALIHLATFLCGFFYGGLNMLDMSWRNTRIAMSVVYGLATTSGIAAITAVAFIVRDGTVKEWQIVSYILLAVEVVVWIFDCMFTMTKLCLVSYDLDKKWYHNIPPDEHAEKMAARKLKKEELALRQRGDMDIDDNAEITERQDIGDEDQVNEESISIEENQEKEEADKEEADKDEADKEEADKDEPIQEPQ